MPFDLRTRVLGVAAALATLLPAQEPAPAVADAWSGFQQQMPGTWLVRWHAPTGTPLEIYGQGYDLDDWRENSLAEARRHANAELARWSTLLGLGDSTFREQIGARMGRTWSFTFAQSFRGLPVIGGRADVRIHMRGRVSFLGSTAVPVPATFDVTPAIGEQTASAIAWQSQGLSPTAVPQPGAPRQPRLAIWADQAATAPVAPLLAWEIPISAVDERGEGPIGRVFVAADSGAVLAFRSDKHECGLASCRLGGRAARWSSPPPPGTYTVMGWVHTQFSPATTPTNEPLVGVEIDVPGHGTVITDQNGQFTLNLTVPVFVTVELDGIHCRRIQGPDPLGASVTLQPGVNQTIQLGAVNSSSNELAHTTTFYWVDRMNELMRSILGNTPELDIASNVQPQVNLPSSCNAYYVGNSINFYHETGSCNNTASASVVAHEWGHGLDDRYGGISQVDGLSEGWGDICSMYLLDDPIIGHGFYQNGNGIRNGNNNRQYPAGGGVHNQGKTWMGFAWRFRENLRAALGTPQAIDVSNNVVLASVVANAIDQPSAVVQAFIADDDDGNIVNGTPHYNELSAACNSHSLPYPPILPGFLAHETPLSTSKAPLVPRLVHCRAVPSWGSFTQVRLHYDDGQPRQRAMIPSGAADTYKALLPGMQSPQVMTYHFEAVHSGGTSYRLPTSGEFSYTTLADETVWLEDFETGGPGWTHGATLGVDDWEIAAPAGFGGAFWQDPTSAYSGTLCAGNDLTGDGAYPPWTSSWLRSPFIDCSGRTNLRLRFKRWASCDVSFLDDLQMWVNGQPVFVSPQTPLQDTQWTNYDVSIASAANNPAVFIEFFLNSDGSQELGGWAIDDVEIYTTHSAVPLTTTLSLSPEQAQQGSPLVLDVRTPTSQPFLWIIGGLPGPTLVAGVPPILVGGNPISFFDYTDGSGSYTLPINAPAGAPLTGITWYSQVLTIDAGFEFVTSNQFVNLFTQ